MIGGITRRLSFVVAASLSRQHRLVTRGMLLAGLAFAFGVSDCSIQRDLYRAISHDALLTNGADVTLTAAPGADASDFLKQMRNLPGVLGAEPLQHSLRSSAATFKISTA